MERKINKRYITNKALTELDEQVAIQTSNGNWNYDPYMHGLANGLILARHTVTGAQGEPPFLKAPKKWLRARPKFNPKAVSKDEKEGA